MTGLIETLDKIGRWQLKGLPWDRLRDTDLTQEEFETLYSALKKLKDYEQLGTPGEIDCKLYELEELKDKLKERA